MKIPVEDLKHAAAELLRSLGASREESAVVADNLVMADMRGIATHGVKFLPLIAERIQADVLAVPTRVTEVSDEGAIAHLDGGNGLGQVAASESMRRAIAKAREFGAGFSLVRNTNHIGLLAYYSAMAAREGMLGICMCNSAAAVAPWGGAEPFFGTNPLSIAAPSGENAPIVLDMSTSVAARGKIRRALKLGEAIPSGWALDEAGIPTEDPAAAMKGSLVPLGGPKGYGLAFFVDLIAGLLSGSKYSRDLLTFHKPLGPTGVGVMTLAVDVRRFMPLDVFNALVKGHVQSIRDSKKAEGNERIYLPGEIEAMRERQSLEDGVEVDEHVVESINTMMGEHGLNVRLSESVSESGS